MKKNQIEISAVIPAYNAVDSIEETIESILKQTLPLKEIIIIDDHSTDRTFQVAKKMMSYTKGQVRVHRNERCMGASTARNIGSSLAKTNWILFMDADDLAEPNLVECEYQRFLELYEEWKQPAVLVHSAYQQINPECLPLPGVHRWQQVNPQEILGYLFVRNYISTSGVLLKKEAFQKVGGFNSVFSHSEDWDLWLRLAKLGGFAYVDEPLVKVRRGTASQSSVLNKMLEGELQVLRQYRYSFIKDAINKRRLPMEANRCDYVSVLFKLGEWEEGYKELEMAEGGYAPAHFLKGLYFLYVRDFSSAEKEFFLRLSYDPRNGAALNNYAILLALKGKKETAAAKFTEAISNYPGYMDAGHNLQVLEKKKMLPFEEARVTWRELRPVLLNYVD